MHSDELSVIDKFGDIAEIAADLKRKDDATIKIQNCWRSYVAWMSGPVAMDRAIQERNQQNMAATTIQARLRGNMGRRKAALWKFHVIKQTYLAVHCQRITRGFLARIFFYYEKKRMRQLRARAATKLQAAWKGKIGRAKARARANEKHRNDMATRINTMVLGFLGRCRFRHELIRIKGNLTATLIQSVGRMYIIRMKLPIYVQERRRWDAQRPISRGFRRYLGQKQGLLRKMLVESGYCAMDPQRKSVCFFEYTGQFLCEKELVKAIKLLDGRKEPWFEDPVTKKRNQLGNIWDLQFFVSKQEKGKYDKQRMEFKKEELAAKAAINTETNALTQVRACCGCESCQPAWEFKAGNFAVSNVFNITSSFLNSTSLVAAQGSARQM